MNWWRHEPGEGCGAMALRGLLTLAVWWIAWVVIRWLW